MKDLAFVIYTVLLAILAGDNTWYFFVSSFPLSCNKLACTPALYRGRVPRAGIAMGVGGPESFTTLPEGISVYERSLSKVVDVQGTIRSLANGALREAVSDGLKLMEIEFPPLLGGDKVRMDKVEGNLGIHF